MYVGAAEAVGILLAEVWLGWASRVLAACMAKVVSIFTVSICVYIVIALINLVNSLNSSYRLTTSLVRVRAISIKSPAGRVTGVEGMGG